MKWIWVWALGALLLVAFGSYLAFLGLRAEDLPAGILYGNGRIEGTEVTVSAEVPAGVVESHVEEGRPIRRGELLVRLDDTELRVRLEQAQAEAEAVRRERATLVQELGTARHHLATAQADLARYQALRRTNTATEQQLRAVEDRVEETGGQIRVLEARSAQAEARVEAAERQVESLKVQLEKTRVTAPIDGTVLVRGIEVGELATPGRAVAVLVDLARLELKVYIPERDIGKVKLGDPARVRIDAFPGRYFEAAVTRVDPRAQFTPRDIHTPEERVRTVFGVTLALANEDGYLKPGMPADAWIRWDPAAAWPEHLAVPR